MSSDQRRKSRIQGGWARQAQTAPAPRNLGPKDEKSVPARNNSSLLSKNNSLLSTPAQIPVVGSSFTSSSSSSSATPCQATFTFDAEAAKLKKEPTRKTIDASGSYVISEEPSGISSIELQQNFIEESEFDWMFDQIYADVPWKQQEVTKAGQTYLQPRLTAWFGEHPYAYSGISHDLNTNWTPVIEMLRDRIKEVTGLSFNSVLANLYRDGHDHVSWHSDDEYSLGAQPVIASLSFGDSRNFELRKKPPPDILEPDDSDYPEYIKVPLDAGSLLIMKGHLQQDWQHRVPREYHDRGPRINLTYRTILPP